MRFALVLAICLSTVLPAVAAPIKVMTWNLEWFPGRSQSADEAAKSEQMAAAQAIVKANDPDILLLQEIADWGAAVELCSVVPGLDVATVSNFGYPQNQVVASKLPADSAWSAKWEGSPLEWNLRKASATVLPMSKHRPVLLKCPFIHH